MTVSLRKPTDEQWKVIPGYEPYEACDLGMIRNGKTGRILKPAKHGPERKQYLTVYVGGGRGALKENVHILVLKAFVGERPSGYLGLHKDDDSFNNHLSNLYWGTYSDNTKDSIENGTYTRLSGYKNGMTKFSDELNVKIKSEFTGKRGEQTRLAKKYGMSISNVHLIVHGKTRVL